MSDFVLYNMDVFKALELIEPESVDCIMTSPPYWGLRDYGVSGQIGLEEHPKQWIDKMVQVSRELKRVLKPSGSYWLNVGDTYFAKRSKDETTDEYYGSGRNGGHPRSMEADGSNWLSAKQKMLMPHRLAIALQDDGWILRNDVVWHKPSHMPSSVRDRLTNSFEFVFHFVKQRKYFYDLDAIREPHATTPQIMGANKNGTYEGSSLKEYATAKAQNPSQTKKRILENLNPSGKNPGDTWQGNPFGHQNPNRVGRDYKDPQKAAEAKWQWSRGQHEDNPNGKNPSDFWAINPKPYPEAHFACFPPALVEKPLKATCPKQICKKCGKPRERIIKTEIGENRRTKDETFASKHNAMGGLLEGGGNYNYPKKETLGFSDCGCNAGWRAGVVLDPFVGSGTTLFVAQKMGLRGIGIELNPDYIPLIKKRLLGDTNQTSLNPNKVEVIR